MSPEGLMLLRPICGKGLHDRAKVYLRHLSPIENSANDIGGEKRKPQNSAKVGLIYAFRFCQLEDRSVPAAFKKPLPAMGSRDGLDHRTVDTSAGRIARLRGWHQNEFSSAAFA
jgi:hypothetical protein